jgi:PAS domain S-box-containing protein
VDAEESNLMKIDLAFNEAPDGRFMVLCMDGAKTATTFTRAPSVFLFESENPFLANVVTADLGEREMVDVVTSVLLSISKPVFPQRWVKIEVTEAQMRELGLFARELAGLTAAANGSYQLPVWNFETARHFHDFMMQAPSPFVMLDGPEHLLTFINPPYMRLIGRDPETMLVGLPIRECLPELEGQPFFGLLDDVYRTGIPFVGTEVLGRLRNQKTGEMEDHYFDFVYHPTRDAAGAVFGIFVQAFDVTERVLDRQVSESREEKLYRQWAELDTLYRTSPVSMCLVDAKDFRILRMNERMAFSAAEPAKELVGRNIFEVFPQGPREQFEKAASGDSIRNFEVATSVKSMPGVLRHWLLNLGPLRGASGEVEAIACVSLEVTERTRVEDRVAESDVTGQCK